MEATCLRCPNRQALEKHRQGDDLSRCLQDEHERPLNEYWPRFRSKKADSQQFTNKAEARAFIENVQKEVRENRSYPSWSKKTMEDAAKLGYVGAPPSKESKANTTIIPDQTNVAGPAVLPPKPGASAVLTKATELTTPAHSKSLVHPAPLSDTGRVTAASTSPHSALLKADDQALGIIKKDSSALETPSGEAQDEKGLKNDLGENAAEDAGTSYDQKEAGKAVCPPEQSHRAQVQKPVELPGPSTAVQANESVKEEPKTESLDKLRGYLDFNKFHISQTAHINNTLKFDPDRKSSDAKSNLDYHTLRPAFGIKNDTKDVRINHVITNHFMVTVPKDTVLYEYRVAGFPDKASRAKRRVLILDMIEKDETLWKARDEIATDNHCKIISTTPLFVTEGLQINVPNYNPGERNEKPQDQAMEVMFVSKHHYGGLNEFTEGENESYQDAGAIEAMNIVLAQALSGKTPDAFQVGRNRFYHRYGWTNLQQNNIERTDNADSAGLVGMRGFVAKLKPAMGSILLNVNTLNSVFYRPQHVSTYLEHFQLFGSLQDNQNDTGTQQQYIPVDKLLEKVRKHLRGLRVYIDFERGEANGDLDMDKPSRRVKTLVDLGSFPKKQMIENEDKKSTTVWKHLRDKYGNDVVKDGVHFPVANVGKVDPPNQKFYLAHHLKVMPDQPYRCTPLPSAVTTAMITAARCSPEENIKAILRDGMKILSMKQLPPMLEKLGMEVNPNMVTVPARILLGPIVHQINADTDKLAGMETTNKGFFRPEERKHFVDVKLGFNDRKRDGDEAIVQFFCPSNHGPDSSFIWKSYRNLENLLPSHGLQKIRCLNKNRIFEKVAKWDVGSLSVDLRKFSNQIDLAIVVFTTSNPESRAAYANFKIVVDQILGMKSVCLNERNVKASLRRDFGYQVPRTHEIGEQQLVDYTRNVAMKLNLRCGYYHHIIRREQLPGLDDSTMILGADVTHPGAGSIRGAPSIAAVVASDDADFARYPGSMRLNPSKQESIDDMKEMVYERLLHWHTKNEGVPSKILFYRDGLGDSQFAKFRHHEVNAIREAHRQIWQQQYPDQKYIAGDLQITAVVVTKRHDTRLYPRLNVPNRDKTSNGNCLPGTVVDSGITHPYYFDFFLLSHNAIQGTGKPAHYLVLENGMGFSPKDLQDLTFNLCHTYGKSANAVSYAPPAYYADRLCERGRIYLQPLYDNAKHYRDQKLSEEDVMVKAKNIFYRHGEHRNPWHENHDGKMFWM